MPPIDNLRGSYSKQRRYRRFDLQFPVSLNLASMEPVRELKAITKNVSIGGLLLNTSDYIAPHTELTFTMVVRSNGPCRIRLAAEAEVVRVEPLGSGQGFSLALECKRPISEMESHLSAAS